MPDLDKAELELVATMRSQLAITCSICSDQDFLRFLAHNDNDVPKAVEHYQSFAVWHRDYGSKLTIASPGVAAELRKR
jgi:hypothetical protein